jgi:hypothetical protein
VESNLEHGIPTANVKIFGGTRVGSSDGEFLVPPPKAMSGLGDLLASDGFINRFSQPPNHGQPEKNLLRIFASYPQFPT